MSPVFRTPSPDRGGKILLRGGSIAEGIWFEHNAITREAEAFTVFTSMRSSYGYRSLDLPRTRQSLQCREPDGCPAHVLAEAHRTVDRPYWPGRKPQEYSR